MGLLFRGLPALIELGLLIYCLIDCIQTPDGAQRNLPKWAWIILIILFPFIGGIAWLVAGRPERTRGQGFVAGYPEYLRRRPGPTAPDDDPSSCASSAG